MDSPDTLEILGTHDREGRQTETKPQHNREE